MRALCLVLTCLKRLNRWVGGWCMRRVGMWRRRCSFLRRGVVLLRRCGCVLGVWCVRSVWSMRYGRISIGVCGVG